MSKSKTKANDEGRERQIFLNNKGTGRDIRSKSDLDIPQL